MARRPNTLLFANFGGNNPVISAGGAEVKSLFLNQDASLTITASGTLAINGGATRGLYNGKQMEQNVLLDWETALEKNNSGFFIERSADGLSWNEIGSVGGNGTSNEPHDSH